MYIEQNETKYCYSLQSVFAIIWLSRKLYYACSLCDKTFSQSSTLMKRMKVHLVEAPYICFKCRKAFCKLPLCKADQGSLQNTTNNAKKGWSWIQKKLINSFDGLEW